MFWLEIGVYVPDRYRDAVGNVFFELGSGIQEDPASFRSGTHIVRGYFPVDDHSYRLVGDLRRRVENILGRRARLEVHKFRDEDWSISWREKHRFFRIGKRLVVKPPWDEYLPDPEDLVIELDPGMAFGCGTHSTTTICLRLLERYVRPGMFVLDVGTGSGILAIGVALLGAGSVWAVDEDAVAVRVARENVARNYLTEQVRVLEGNLLDDFVGSADLVVANILAEVLTGLCPTAADLLVPGGLFILSGIVESKEEMVCNALVTNHFKIETRLAEKGWVALVGVKV